MTHFSYYMHLVVNLIIFCVHSTALQSQTWRVNINATSSSPFYYFWDTAVGSGHSALLLRSDWRQLMKDGHDAINFSMVRAHGILDDDVGVVNSKTDFSFINVDKIYEWLLSIGMMPYVEITFMPGLFASADTTVCHYKGNTSPPQSWSEWYNLIYSWVSHLVDYFGIEQVMKFKFEVWNEPQKFGGFWNGNYSQYFMLYNTTATAIKAVNTKLSVGGPTINNASIPYLKTFLNDVVEYKVPIDFVVLHSYPNDPWIGVNITGIDAYYNVLKAVIDFVESYNMNLPVWISEFNSGCCTDAFDHGAFPNNDNFYSAAFMTFMAKYLQPLFPKQAESTFKFMSYWAISDVFEEGGFNSNEFKNLYGMQTIRGIKKPVFRSLELLHKYGSNLQYETVLIDGNGLNMTNDTVQVYTLKNKNSNDGNRYSIFVVNWNNYGFPINEETVQIFVNNLVNSGSGLETVVLYRIDANNTAPLNEWIKLGSPKYPTQQQLRALNKSSEVMPLNVTYIKVNDTTIQISVDMLAYSVAVLDLQY